APVARAGRLRRRRATRAGARPRRLRRPRTRRRRALVRVHRPRLGARARSPPRRPRRALRRGERADVPPLLLGVLPVPHDEPYASVSPGGRARAARRVRAPGSSRPRGLASITTCRILVDGPQRLSSWSSRNGAPTVSASATLASAIVAVARALASSAARNATYVVRRTQA